MSNVDFAILQRGIVGKGVGTDTYVLSNNLVQNNAKITLSDTGFNTLHLIDGLEISSSKVAANALLLTLSNGAEVTVLDAANYEFVVGGDPITGETGTSYDLQGLASNVLGVEVPTSGIASGGDTTLGQAASSDSDAAIESTMDTLVVQRGINGKGSGHDTYVLSNNWIEAGAEITITDTGNNTIQFIDGLEVASSMVAPNALMLTLSNGATVTVLDAGDYTFEVGGNPWQDDIQSTLNFGELCKEYFDISWPIDDIVKIDTQLNLEKIFILGDETLRLDIYPALYEKYYYNKIVNDLQFSEVDDLFVALDNDLRFLSGLNQVTVATGLEANGNGFTYSAGAIYNNTYNTSEITADISSFTIDGMAANPFSFQSLLKTTEISPGKVGGIFNSITLSANSVDYLTLKYSANGLSLVYDNASPGMINELRLDGIFNNDLNKIIPLFSDLMDFDFNDPLALLGSREFLDTSDELDSMATLSGLSILQKGVADPYFQLTTTDTTLNFAYKDWDIVGAIEVSPSWQPDPDALLAALQNLMTDSNGIDLSKLNFLYHGAGSLSLSIMHDDAGKLAEGIIHDFGDLLGSLDLDAGDELIFGTKNGDSYAIDSNGLASVVFKEREFNEGKITELLNELDIAVVIVGEEESDISISPTDEVASVFSLGEINSEVLFIDSLSF